jgi:hypothetical protein
MDGHYFRSSVALEMSHGSITTTSGVEEVNYLILEDRVVAV